MFNKYRINTPSWSMIVLTLAVITLGFLTLSNNQLAVASRLDQESDTSQDAVDAVAAVPTTLAYQGILRGIDGSLITGQRDITIKIYNSITGGSVLHTETIPGVQVRDGVFNVVLGDVTPIANNVFADAPRFLGITVAPDPEMVPRQRLHPVPWAQQATTALQANHASTADQATSANQANVANTLVDNATVKGLSITHPGLKLPTWSVFRIEGPADRQTAAYFSMGGQGAFQVDSPGVVGGRFIITTDGNVGIGNPGPAYKLDVAGKVRASQGFNGNCVQNSWNPGVVGSNINISCNQDVAETFATTELTEPGDVVVLQPQAAAEPTVHLSQQPYAGQLVGVVSTNPGLVFDRGQTYLAGNNADLITADRTVVAMIGRVPVKISLENGDIAVGDPLASSSEAGAAMKATQVGQIIGYALQGSDELSSDGTILAWLQLGYYIPPQALARLNTVSPIEAASGADEEIASLRAENASLAARIEALEGQQ